MDWIYKDRLAVGDLQDSLNNKAKRFNKISFTVDARVCFDKSEDCVNPSKALLMSVIIISIIKSGFKVLIHCKAGMDRSPFIGMLTLKRLTGMDYNDCYTVIKTARPMIIEHYEWVDIIRYYLLEDYINKE